MSHAYGFSGLWYIFTWRYRPALDLKTFRQFQHLNILFGRSSPGSSLLFHVGVVRNLIKCAFLMHQMMLINRPRSLKRHMTTIYLSLPLHRGSEVASRTFIIVCLKVFEIYRQVVSNSNTNYFRGVSKSTAGLHFNSEWSRLSALRLIYISLSRPEKKWYIFWHPILIFRGWRPCCCGN